MKRLQTLQTLLEREQARRDEAQAALRAAMRQAESAAEQADSLSTYRGEYVKRWSAQFAHSGAIEIVRCYQGFIERLDQAIGLQAQQVQNAQAQVQAARRRLQEREVRVATVERLIQRHQRQLAAQHERREQKNLDEMALRRRAGPALFGAA